MGITEGVSGFKFRLSSQATARMGTTEGFAPFRVMRRRREHRAAGELQAGRRIRRGLWVAVLGPDGVGKSSVIEGMGSGKSAGFAGCERFHLRAVLGRNLQRNRRSTSPHAQAARSMGISVLKLGYLLAVNWLGYLAVVRPRVARGMLVLFDRHFLDYLVDGKRYRMPASCGWLTKLVAAMVPKPDLWVVLDAPADTLQKRKQEVTVAESERQQRDYARLAARLRNATVVNATRPVDEVLNEVMERIIELHLAPAEKARQWA